MLNETVKVDFSNFPYLAKTDPEKPGYFISQKTNKGDTVLAKYYWQQANDLLVERLNHLHTIQEMGQWDFSEDAEEAHQEWLAGLNMIVILDMRIKACENRVLEIIQKLKRVEALQSAKA